MVANIADERTELLFVVPAIPSRMGRVWLPDRWTLIGVGCSSKASDTLHSAQVDFPFGKSIHGRSVHNSRGSRLK